MIRLYSARDRPHCAGGGLHPVRAGFRQLNGEQLWIGDVGRALATCVGGHPVGIQGLSSGRQPTGSQAVYSWQHLSFCSLCFQILRYRAFRQLQPPHHQPCRRFETRAASHSKRKRWKQQEPTSSHHSGKVLSAIGLQSFFLLRLPCFSPSWSLELYSEFCSEIMVSQSAQLLYLKLQLKKFEWLRIRRLLVYLLEPKLLLAGMHLRQCGNQ